MDGRTYRIFGYKGKQVRDAIHSQFEQFMRAPCQYDANQGTWVRR